MGTVTQGPINGQWLRFAQLVVSNGTTGIDLSNLRFRFEVRADDCNVPNTLTVRVYNIAPNTLNTLLSKGTASSSTPALPPGATLVQVANTAPQAAPQEYLFNVVNLTAGYQNGNQRTIFQGDVITYKFGRERNVDSFIELACADGDVAYNGSAIAQTFPAGATASQQLSAIASAAGTPLSQNADDVLLAGGTLPRGKTLFGMSKLALDGIARNNNCRWSIQNGVVTLIPVNGYAPGDIIQINSATGMLGTPEATDNGIIVRCLLNPLIQVGQRIQINNADITTSIIAQQGIYPSYGAQYYPASVTNDGIYRVLVVEHVGDTRDNDWYSELTCLAVDPSSPANSSVLTAG